MTLSPIHKKYIFSLIFLCNSLIINAQQVYPPFVFSQIPQNFQLYPRNEQKVGIIPISGVVQDKNWKTISVLVFREGKLFGYQKNNIQNDAFSLNPSIKAEKAEYSIKIYASRGNTDSTFITERTNLVAGDFYVIYGDSNGNTQNVTPTDYYSSNKYIRTFGRYVHEVQPNYAPKDTTWSQNENYYFPKVGLWGTFLQEKIVEKYGVPVCIITGGGPGAYMDLLASRNGDGVSSPGTLYNILGYRIKKSGLINHIKGFFLWQGVYELFSITNPVEYDTKLKRLMGYLKQDFPSVQNYVIFQSGLVKFNLNGSVGANIRESQRNLVAQSPNMIPYAAEGLKGSDGVHYSIEGYNKLADEMLAILEPLYYEKPTNANAISPNLQKVFYTDASHQTIKLVFQTDQKIVLDKDTTVKSNNQNVNVSLKNYFYQNNIYSQGIDLQNITTDDNAVLLQTTKSLSAKKLSYLPPYHTQYSLDFPIFIGPYIRTILGQRAMSFANVTIQEPLANVTSLTSQTTTNQVKLSWKNPSIPENALIILERKLEKESDYKRINTLKSNIAEYQDNGLAGGTIFNYRLKIIADSSESNYVQINAKTIDALGKPTLAANILYNNKAQISWNTVDGAENYQLQKRLKTSNQYNTLLTTVSIKSLIDSTLQPNQLYVYKITTTRKPNESTADSIEVITPALLTKPELTATVLFYNSLKINWKTIVGGNQYKLERKTGAEEFKLIGNFDNKTIEWIDKDLKENTAYTYRIKVFGDKTESLESTLPTQTSSILANPELAQAEATHEKIKLTWKAIPTANKYLLERKAQNETGFQKIFEDNLLEYTDAKLKNNTAYSYRLKAFSSVSESGFSQIESKTLGILANQNEENALFKIFPNPTHDKLTVSFSSNLSGNMSIHDFVGRTLFEQKIVNQKSLEINVSHFMKGAYLMVVRVDGEFYGQKFLVD
jgi:hypothetical protein